MGVGRAGFLAESRVYSPRRELGEIRHNYGLGQTGKYSVKPHHVDEIRTMKLHRNFALVALTSVLLAGFHNAAQQPSASIQGVVVEAGSTNPVSKATVTLSRAGAAPAEVTRTDSDGRFYLLNIVPGQYRIVVSHAGHVKAQYGQTHPGGDGSTLF